MDEKDGLLEYVLEGGLAWNVFHMTMLALSLTFKFLLNKG